MEILKPKINHHQQQQYFPRSSKPNTAIICKKHPKHQQSPGVCSICLCEKLSHLSKSKSSRGKNSRSNKVFASIILINAAADDDDEEEEEEEEEEENSSCSSSSLSNYSPSQCSSCASSPDCSSPLYRRMARGPYNNLRAEGAAGGINHNYFRDLQLLKSRSMADATTSYSRRNRQRILLPSEGTADRHLKKQKQKQQKKKSHFWSKLLLLSRPRGKRCEEAACGGAPAGLVHSRTMKEMLTTAVH